jgi:Cu/Ag efflux pump CusA
LYQLPLDTPNGGHVPLGAVASIVVSPAPSVIYRENGTPNDEVDANINGRSLGSTVDAVHAALAKIKLPRGYRVAILGEAAERAAAQKTLLEYGIGALLLILLLLQAAFQNWRVSILEFLTLPMALVGGVIAAWADLGTITLGALVGFFTVLGIAARNGILMISHFRHLESEEDVPFGRELVLRGASERLSPILMTALATALALAPLVVYGNRPGQEIEFPMAIVILGGLTTSTLLNLFVLPSLYLRLARPKATPPTEPEAPEPQVAEVMA